MIAGATSSAFASIPMLSLGPRPMDGADARPTASRRAAATALVAAVVVATLVQVVDEPGRVLIHLVLLTLLVAGI
jgi:hypothetical protein